MIGRVKWFNSVKGYGFAEGEDKKDYFCHFSEIQDGERGKKNLVENQTITFEPSIEAKGPRAKTIRV